MTKAIQTYEELLAEKQKLEVLFQAQKALVKYEMDDLKKELHPVMNAVEFLKKISVRNKDNPILQTVANLLIDRISEKTEGSHAGFLRTTVLPYIIKNYASHFIADHADKFITHLLSLFEDDETESENPESFKENGMERNDS